MSDKNSISNETTHILYPIENHPIIEMFLTFCNNKCVENITKLKQAMYLTTSNLLSSQNVREEIHEFTPEFFEISVKFGYFYDQIDLVQKFLYNYGCLEHILIDIINVYGETIQTPAVKIYPSVNHLCNFLRGGHVNKGIFSEMDLTIILDLYYAKLGACNIARFYKCDQEVIKYWVLNHTTLDTSSDSAIKGVLADLTELHLKCEDRAKLYVSDDEMMATATKLYIKSKEHVDNAGALEDINVKNVLAIQKNYVDIKNWYKELIRLKDQDILEGVTSQEELNEIVTQAIKLLNLQPDQTLPPQLEVLKKHAF